MANLNNGLDTDIDDESSVALGDSKLNKKKLLVILLPALIVIAIVGFYYKAHNDKKNSIPTHYSIVQNTNEDEDTDYTILYDLPEIEVRLRSEDKKNQILRTKINIELSGIDNIPTIDALTPKLSDAIISHIVGLSVEEISGAEGLYWLKKELLYRFNLITTPVKITNLNFKNFEVIKG